jgi:hypothetical protein
MGIRCKAGSSWDGRSVRTRDACGKPHASDIPDQQYRGVTGGGHSRGEKIVDSKIAVNPEWHTGRIGIVSGGRVRRPAKERGVNALSGVGPNAIARSQKKAPSHNLDVSIKPNHGREVSNPPGRTRRNTAHDVEVYRSIGCNTGYRNYPDAAFEFQLAVSALRGRDACDGYGDECYQHSADQLPGRGALAKLSKVILIHNILLFLSV